MSAATDHREYRGMLQKFTPRPIRSEQDYEHAMAILDKIMTPNPSPAASQMIELLATLIESYESKAHPIPRVSPARLLKHLIEGRGVRPVDVARETGGGAATLSNVMAERRAISKANALRLAGYFHVAPESFFEAV